MAPIVAPQVCRFTINGTYAGEEVANVIDMQVDTTGGPEDRPTACYLIAGDILNNWDDHIRPGLVAAYTAVSVSWVDLNSLDGSTGERTSTSDTTWPANGGDSGAPSVGAGSVRLNKLQDGGRRARNGRLYLPGYSEGWTTSGQPNFLTPAIVAGWNESASDFLEGINDAEGPNNDHTRKMVVVHTVGGTYIGYSDVTALVCQAEVATQRRRMPGS